jgi:hypothetical protein
VTNHERSARRAEKTIERYREYTGTTRFDEPDQEVLRRIVVDLAHLLWRHGYDVKQAFADAHAIMRDELDELV